MKARFLIEVEHIDHLKELRESMLAVPGVVSVTRVDKPSRIAPGQKDASAAASS